MCQLKTCMCFLFSQPIIGCQLLTGKLCLKCSHGAQKKCPLKQMSAIKVSAV